MYILNHFILLSYFTILYYCDFVLFAGGYKCRLTTFSTRFAHMSLLFAIVTALL